MEFRGGGLRAGAGGGRRSISWRNSGTARPSPRATSAPSISTACEGFTSMWMVLPTPGSAVVVDRLARGRLAFDDLDQPMVSPRAAWRTAPRRSIVQLEIGRASCRERAWKYV